VFKEYLDNTEKFFHTCLHTSHVRHTVDYRNTQNTYTGDSVIYKHLTCTSRSS